MYKVIDLFAGAGGLSFGFRQTHRFDIKVAFEINSTMKKTYKKNHPLVDVRGDVRSADYSKIKEQYGDFDVVIGGPPCQGFSNANRQKNQAINMNNSMVKEYVRAIIELKPKAFVLENVSMLRSSVHRFYLSKQELSLVEDKKLSTKESFIKLLDSKFMFSEAPAILKDQKLISAYLWSANDYAELNIIYKIKRNEAKMAETLEKHKTKLLTIADHYVSSNVEDVIIHANIIAFEGLKAYYLQKIDQNKLVDLIEPALMYQRMLQRAVEIYENDLVIDRYDTENGLAAVVRSFTVYDYLKVKLENGDDNSGYVINDSILSAVEFGAPQKRKRFVIMGLRKDIAVKVDLPKGKYKEDKYRTVKDAIYDLSDVPPIYNPKEDDGIPLKHKDDLSDLAESLRDSEVLFNHIITKSSPIALERFKSLQQGQNFHALDDSLKINTYTDVSRTQNTIYLRLNYNEPSGTVVNVRKSMWVHPTENRAVSVREAARLQTFPDSFIFCGSKDKQYQQVGNAVPPIMANAIAESLAKQLDNALAKKII